MSLQQDVVDLVITLQPGADLTFSVQSWRGEPVGFLPVDFVGLDGQLPVSKEGFSREDGLIYIEDLPRGRWQAFITSLGSRAVSLPVTAPGGPYSVVLEPGGELKIKFPNIERSTEGVVDVLDATGQIFSPAEIGLALSQWPVRWKLAFVGGLAPGTWSYRVSLDDGRTFEGSAVISPGQTTELVLE